MRDIVALGDRHKEIVDAIGEQQSSLSMALSAQSRPSNFSVQRRVVAAFGKKGPFLPLTHDFKITLDEAVSNVIDVSLDECIVPLVRHNVFTGHNDVLHLGIVQGLDINSCAYDEYNGKLKLTVTTVGANKNVEEFAEEAAKVHAAVAPVGSPLGVRIKLNYDICVHMDGSSDVFDVGNEVILRWGRCVENYTVAFTSNAVNEDYDTIGVRLFLRSGAWVSQACMIGIAKRQNVFSGVETPPSLTMEHLGLQVGVPAENIMSLELNHTDGAHDMAGMPILASSKDGNSQVVTRISDHLIMLPCTSSHIGAMALPAIGAVFKALHEPQATLVDIARDKQGRALFVLRLCYIQTQALSPQALAVDGFKWTDANCQIQGVVGVSTEGTLPHVAMNDSVHLNGIVYRCTGNNGTVFPLYVLARRSGNPGPVYYDTLLDNTVVGYDATEITIPNILQGGHACHCGSYSYDASKPKSPMGGCFRTSNALVTVVGGTYTTMMYAAAVSRTVNSIISALDIGKPTSAATFYILFGTDGGGFTQMVRRSNSTIKSVHYRKRAHCRVLGLGTEHSTMHIAVGKTTNHPNTGDPSAGAASRVVHIRLLELEGVLCPARGPWRTFLVPDAQTSLTYASTQKEDTFASALATQFHAATKRTLTVLRSITVRMSDGDGIPLTYVPPGAILILNISYLHAAIDGGSGPLVV
jgi:hypothetical protein